MNQSLIKKIIVVILLLMGVVLIGFGLKKFLDTRKTGSKAPESVEIQLKNLIEGSVEQWNLYHSASDNHRRRIGNDPACPESVAGREEFMAYYRQVQEKKDARWLDLTNGAYLMYTPNYNNWDNAALFSLTEEDMRRCSSGWLTPLYAFEDKILWGEVTCSQETREDRVAYCQLIGRIVSDYFAGKPR